MKLFKVYTNERGIVETNIYGEVDSLTYHREDGPAFIEYDYNGNIRYEEYRINGEKHRLNGPAGIYYNASGTLINEVYYINNIWYTKENYHKELLKLKLHLL